MKCSQYLFYSCVFTTRVYLIDKLYYIVVCSQFCPITIWLIDILFLFYMQYAWVFHFVLALHNEWVLALLSFYVLCRYLLCRYLSECWKHGLWVRGSVCKQPQCAAHLWFPPPEFRVITGPETYHLVLILTRQPAAPRTQGAGHPSLVSCGTHITFC